MYLHLPYFVGKKFGDIIDSRSDLIKHGHSSHERGFGIDIVFYLILTFMLPCMCYVCVDSCVSHFMTGVPRNKWF